MAMARIPRIPTILMLLACFLCASTAGATTSLGFGADGYSISMEIGHDQVPVVASLKVHTPRAPGGVLLRGNFTTTVFDPGRRLLSLRFEQTSAGAEPGSFRLDVGGHDATLRIDGRVITGHFSWEM